MDKKQNDSIPKDHRFYFSDVEYWKPTNELRWKRFNVKRILQQKWHSNYGQDEWRDVPDE